MENQIQNLEKENLNLDTSLLQGQIRHKKKRKKIIIGTTLIFACLIVCGMVIGIVAWKFQGKNNNTNNQFTVEFAEKQVSSFFSNDLPNKTYDPSGISSDYIINDRYNVPKKQLANNYPPDKSDLDNFLTHYGYSKASTIDDFCPYVGTKSLNYHHNPSDIIDWRPEYFSKNHDFQKNSIIFQKSNRIKTPNNIGSWSFTIQVHLLTSILNGDSAKGHIVYYGYWNDEVSVTTNLTVLGYYASYPKGDFKKPATSSAIISNASGGNQLTWTLASHSV